MAEVEEAAEAAEEEEEEEAEEEVAAVEVLAVEDEVDATVGSLEAGGAAAGEESDIV